MESLYNLEGLPWTYLCGRTKFVCLNLYGEQEWVLL